MRTHWAGRAFKTLFWVLLASALVGLLINQIAWALVAGLVLYQAWHLRQMIHFQQWLDAGRNELPPEARGLWGDIFDRIHHIQRRDSRMRGKQQLVIDRIQASTAALSDAVVMVDTKGRLEWWNRAAERLLGLRAPDDSGQHVTNLLRDPRFVEYFEANHFGEPLDIASHLNLSTRLQYTITQYGEGEHLMVVRDTSRLHNLEQMRKDFVANVSHELRTPLTVIVGYLETLQDSDEPINPRWKRALQQMEQQSRRMQNLLNDLLLLARLENEDRTIEQRPVDISEMLKSITQDARALSAERGHQIILETGSGIKLSGADAELRSAFSNLAFNAVKYTPDQGEIRLCCWLDEQGAHVSVGDNGAGIAAQHINRLTERFYRVDSSRSTHTGGTGLGLAIVKHVLLRHDGRLDISSTVGKGSTFTCHFPVSRLA
ncbi:phosphate regulon sensor histidine kinase PhoR [Halopseudomonas sp.]|uniref:phosphate regulon sensor histidine kinase PhoR n=1 Tax=Halopseudomonas sp. TaxID=2901191 RepID=UPI0039E26D1A